MLYTSFWIKSGGTKWHVPISYCSIILNVNFDHLRWKPPKIVHGKIVCVFACSIRVDPWTTGVEQLRSTYTETFSLNRYCYSATWSVVDWIHRIETTFMEELLMWRAVKSREDFLPKGQWCPLTPTLFKDQLFHEHCRDVLLSSVFHLMVLIFTNDF